MTKTTKTMKFEIRWESQTGSGTTMVDAKTEAEARQKFQEEWLFRNEYDETVSVPSHWVVGRWIVEG